MVFPIVKIIYGDNNYDYSKTLKHKIFLQIFMSEISFVFLVNQIVFIPLISVLFLVHRMHSYDNSDENIQIGYRLNAMFKRVLARFWSSFRHLEMQSLSQLHILVQFNW